MVNGYKVFAHAAAVGVLLGGAGAPVPQPVHAAVNLLSADGPLAGSETALILGGTTEPTPSAEYARSAEDLFLNPLGFDDGATDSTVCTMDGTDPCSAPLQVLTTPELIQQGPSSLTGASNTVLAVENEFDANPDAFSAEHPLTVFGYSQSATAESIAMSRLEDAGIPSDELHFVFIGDPSTPDGIWQHLEAAMDAMLGTSLTDKLLDLLGITDVLGSSTPNDLYPTTIYGLDDDPVSNFTDVYEDRGLWGALFDILGPHVNYLGLTPEQVADSTTSTDGEITNIDISDDFNHFDAWTNAVFSGGAANSGLLESVSDSLQLLFNNVF